MTPTREQFKEFIAFVKNAKEKEDKVNDAFQLIWDDDQAQNVPFYISPLWTAVRYAFCLMFNQEFKRFGETDDLYWWMETAPKNYAKYWIDEEEFLTHQPRYKEIDIFFARIINQMMQFFNAKSISDAL